MTSFTSHPPSLTTTISIGEYVWVTMLCSASARVSGRLYVGTITDTNGPRRRLSCLPACFTRLSVSMAFALLRPPPKQAPLESLQASWTRKEQCPAREKSRDTRLVGQIHPPVALGFNTASRQV